MAELVVSALMYLWHFYISIWKEQRESVSSVRVGPRCPRPLGTWLCVCAWVGWWRHTHTRTHITGTRCSLLASGLFSMEPKAQPSANIRKAQGQYQWIGGWYSHLLANTHTQKHTNGHVIQRLRFMLAFLSLLHFVQVFCHSFAEDRKVVFLSFF